MDLWLINTERITLNSGLNEFERVRTVEREITQCNTAKLTQQRPNVHRDTARGKVRYWRDFTLNSLNKGQTCQLLPVQQDNAREKVYWREF